MASRKYSKQSNTSVTVRWIQTDVRRQFDQIFTMIKIAGLNKEDETPLFFSNRS